MTSRPNTTPRGSNPFRVLDDIAPFQHHRASHGAIHIKHLWGLGAGIEKNIELASDLYCNHLSLVQKNQLHFGYKLPG